MQHTYTHRNMELIKNNFAFQVCGENKSNLITSKEFFHNEKFTTLCDSLNYVDSNFGSSCFTQFVYTGGKNRANYQLDISLNVAWLFAEVDVV